MKSNRCKYSSQFICTQQTYTLQNPFPYVTGLLYIGKPLPNVTWYLDNSVIDESFEHRPDGKTTVNYLSYPNIGRQHVNARFVCMASNTNLTPPTNKVVILDVNRKYPLNTHNAFSIPAMTVLHMHHPIITCAIALCIGGAIECLAANAQAANTTQHTTHITHSPV